MAGQPGADNFFAAGRTFAAGLMFEEVNGFINDPIHRDGIVNNDHGGRTEVRTECANGGVIHLGIQNLVIRNNK